MRRFSQLVILLLIACTSVASAQDGKSLYQAHCAMCHDSAQGRIPPVSALQAMSRAAILDALESGVMKVQGASLSNPEKRAIAAYLGTAPSAASAVTENTCPAREKEPPLPEGTGNWTSWGADIANTRFQSGSAAGLTASRVPTLKLKWAFGLGSDAEPRSQPAVVNGTVYVGAKQLYALDAASGCTKWNYTPDAAVRSGILVGPDAAGHAAVFFGDAKGNISAVSAITGSLIWKKHVDDHFAAMVSNTPALYKRVLYAGVSSFEEVMAGSPKYPCCSFRGSVVALDAATGKQIWKTYTIETPSRPIAGTTRNGPSGAGVWSTPTIDEKLQRLYVSTGDNYSDPATGTSDSILALDLATGKILWTRQVTSGDIYNVGCDPGVHGACPETHGHDFDFGQSPVLVALANGKRALVIAQKSGVVYGFDPDADGKPVWSKRIGEGGTLGGSQWGSAARDGRVYVALSDLRLHGVPDPKEKMGFRLEADGAKGGGLFALDASTGEIIWSAKPAVCGDRKLCSPAQSAAVSGIPGVVFSGALDGHLRAYAIETGSVIWDIDTEREYTTVNGEKGHGGAVDVAGPVIAGGAVYVMSGYGRYGGMPGNVLLVYGP